MNPANRGSDCDARVNSYRQILKSHGKLGEVFRYHALPDFVSSLDSAAAPAAS